MKEKKGIGSHQSSKMKNDEWLTPPEILNSFPEFDLDPCAPVFSPWKMANKTYDKYDDGLSKEWSGRVWMNPPYGKYTGKWLEKLKRHGNGIALIFARTETRMFFDHVWNNADALFFIKGRLYFYHVDGTKAKMNAGAPSVLIAYGHENARLLQDHNIEGKFILLQNNPIDF